MQKVAEGWLIYRLTNSAFTLGLVGFFSLAPLVPVSLVAGVMSDRMSRRTLLVLTQVGLIFPPLALAVLAWAGRAQVWHIVVVELVMGALGAIDQPSRQALVVEVVGSDDLDNAIGLSASGFNVSRVLGPAVAGLLVASLGEAACFALNGLTYLAVVAALLAMRLPKREIKQQDSLSVSLIDGFRYLAREEIIVALIGLITIVSVFIVPYQTLLPIFARDILKAGARGLGFLTTAAGVGAVIGGLGIAHLSPGRRGKYLIGIGVAVSAVAATLAISRSFALSCVALTLIGAGVVAIKAIAITLIQHQVRDELRGRVMGVVTMLNGGMPAFGGLVVGFLASWWNAPVALGLGALGCLLACLSLGWQVPKLRQLP